MNLSIHTIRRINKYIPNYYLMRMLYQVPPLYRDRTQKLKLLALTLLIIFPIILLVLGNQGLTDSIIILIAFNTILPILIIGIFIVVYYPQLLRTYGSQTFYSTEKYLIRVDQIGILKFKKKWDRKIIKSVRKNIDIQEKATRQPEQSQIVIGTRLLIERPDDSTEVLLRADDAHLNGLLHELKLAGFNTKGLMHQALDKAKELFDRFTTGDLR